MFLLFYLNVILLLVLVFMFSVLILMLLVLVMFILMKLVLGVVIMLLVLFLVFSDYVVEGISMLWFISVVLCRIWLLDIWFWKFFIVVLRLVMFCICDSCVICVII